MSALVACQFPDPFHGIEVWTVRGEKIQLHGMTVFMQPRLELTRVMPTRVVHDHEHCAAFATMTHELVQKRLERRSVERIRLTGDKASILDADGAKHGHALASGRVQHYGIDVLRRNPHRAS